MIAVWASCAPDVVIDGWPATPRRCKSLRTLGVQVVSHITAIPRSRGPREIDQPKTGPSHSHLRNQKTGKVRQRGRDNYPSMLRIRIGLVVVPRQMHMPLVGSIDLCGQILAIKDSALQARHTEIFLPRQVCRIDAPSQPCRTSCLGRLLPRDQSFWWLAQQRHTPFL